MVFDDYVQALDPSVAVLRRSLLHLEWPLLYVGAERPGPRGLTEPVILVFRVDRIAPQLLHELVLPSHAIGVVKHEGDLYFARPDGLTAVRPACAPMP